MVATSATPTAVALWRDWRGWPAALAALWRRSLSFRTITVTLLLTSFAIFVTSVTMALVIQNDLFDSRKNQVLDDSLRAVAAAQNTLDSSDVSDDPTALKALWSSIPEVITRVSSSDLIAAFPLEEAAGSRILPFTSPGLSTDLLSAALRQRVSEFPDRQAWQSVSLSAGGSQMPGIVV